MRKVLSIGLAFQLTGLFVYGQITGVSISTSPSACNEATGSVAITSVSGGVPPYQYSLNGQVYGSDTLFSPLPLGDTTVYVRDNNGFVFQNETTIDSLSHPKIAVSGVDQECEFKPGSITLESVTNAAEPYQVFLDSSLFEQQQMEVQAGFYEISVTDANGCTSIKGVDIDNDCIVISQGFSPNGDGINDTWSIEKLARYPNSVIQVFNRNGTLVFSAKGYDQNWDGTALGLSLPTGTYYYLIKIDEENPSADVFTGYVAIVR